MDTLKDAGTKAVASVSAVLGSGSGSGSGGKGVIIIMLLAATVAAFFVVGALYYAAYNYIAVSNTYRVKGTDIPILASKLTTFPGTDIPSMNNGKRLTVSWWLYINDMLTNDGQIRRVFNRGDNVTNYGQNSFPCVVLDPHTNKVHVIFHTTDVSQFMQQGVDATKNLKTDLSDSEAISFLSQTHGIRFDYVPMQRWVHLAVVIDEEANGGTVMGYLDGELVKTVTTSVQLDSVSNPITLAKQPQTPVYLEIQHLDLGSGGDINIGGDGTTTIGFSGLVSRISFTNTDLNANDIWQQYRAGPTNILNRFGLNYGLQSPVYRLS